MVRQAIRLRIASRERLMFADLVSMKRMCASTKTHSGQHHIALSWPLSVCMSARAAFRSSPLRVNMSAVCSCIYLHLLVVHVEYYSVRSGTTLILHRIPNLLRRLRLLRQVGLLWGACSGRSRRRRVGVALSPARHLSDGPWEQILVRTASRRVENIE